MSDLKGWNSIVTDVYQIHGIPMLFVLDENNRIVGEGLRGEELEKMCTKGFGTISLSKWGHSVNTIKSAN